MLLSHQDPHLTLGGLVARLVSDGLDRYDPARPPRARRTGGRGSVEGGQSASKPARRQTEAGQRNRVRANGSDVERRSEVEGDDRSLAADRVGNPRPSAPTRHTQTECDNTNSSPVRDGGGRTDSAAKRASEAEYDGSPLVAVPSGGGHTTSAAKRQSQAGPGPMSQAAQAAARDGDGQTASAPNRYTEAERGGANSAAVKRGGQDDVAYVEQAERLCRVTGSASDRHCEAVQPCRPPKAMHGNGERAASQAKRQAQAGGGIGDAEKAGVLDRALCGRTADRSRPAQPVAGTGPGGGGAANSRLRRRN